MCTDARADMAGISLTERTRKSRRKPWPSAGVFVYGEPMIKNDNELRDQLTTKVTTPALLNAIREVAAAEPTKRYQRPDPTSEKCYYFHDDQPGCIIGQALAKLGVEPFPELESNKSSVEDLLHTIIPARELDAISHAQSSQDNGANWGDAVAHMDRRLLSQNSPYALNQKEAA